MSWWSRLLGRDEETDRDPTASAIHFDTEGWRSLKARANMLEWRDDLGNTVRVCAYATPAEHLGEPPDIGSLRSFCRRQADARGGAIVSVEIANIGGIRCLKAIAKYERRPSYDYEGTITIPLGDSHFAIVMNATEHGVTGSREAVVTSHLLTEGEIDVSQLTGAASEGLPIPGWFQDPYDPDYEGRVLHSLSDDARFDALFPDHPLSRVRCSLARIERSLEVDPSVPVSSAPRFRIDDTVEGPLTSPVSAEAVGRLYLQVGRYDQVEKVITERLDQLERSSAADPTAVARGSLLLGFAYEGQHELARAETAFRTASASFEAALGEDDPNTAQAMNNLARILIGRGRHEEAEPLFRRALRVFQRAEGSGSSNAGVALNGLGLVYNARGLYSQAIPFFECALTIFERVHGPTFPDVATVLRNIAFSWKRLGNMERMVEAWQRAERVDREQRTG